MKSPKQSPTSTNARANFRSKIWSALSFRNLLWVFLVAGAIGAGFYFDSKVATYPFESKLPGDLQRAVMLSEAFSHGFGVITILVLVALSSDKIRSNLMRDILVVLVPCAISTLIKYTIVRVRPRQPEYIFDLYAPGFQSFYREVSNRIAELNLGGSNLQSFPSGHTTAAFALATLLSHHFPRGKYGFYTLAVLAGFQRILSDAHYLSDVISGAVLGTCAALMVLKMIKTR